MQRPRSPHQLAQEGIGLRDADDAELICLIPINGRFEVLDMNGRMVRDVAVNASTSDVSASGWSPGVYLLRAANTSGRVLGTQRVVIE